MLGVVYSWVMLSIILPERRIAHLLLQEVILRAAFSAWLNYRSDRSKMQMAQEAYGGLIGVAVLFAFRIDKSRVKIGRYFINIGNVPGRFFLILVLLPK